MNSSKQTFSGGCRSFSEDDVQNAGERARGKGEGWRVVRVGMTGWGRELLSVWAERKDGGHMILVAHAYMHALTVLKCMCV